MIRTTYVILLLLLISSCAKDDSCVGVNPLAPVSIAFNIVDENGEDLIFGENPEYPYRKLKFYNLNGERLVDNILYRNVLANGDTVLGMKQDTVVILFPDSGGEDTIQFFDVGRTQVGCFNYQKYTVYYNDSLIFEDIYTSGNQPVSIIK